MGSDYYTLLGFPYFIYEFIKRLENMDILSVSERNKLRDKEVDKMVNDVFRRAHKIRKIRRKRKIIEWLKGHKN